MQNSQPAPREVPYRFVNFGIYFVTALVNSLPVHTFSSINTLVEDKFHLDSAYVTLNALLFTIAHPLLALPCNWILEKYGMKKGFLIGGALLIAGVWLRTLLEFQNTVWCLVGSGLAAAGNIFMLNSPSKVAANWFKVQSIPSAVFLAVLANLMSITLGASLPGLVLSKNSSIDQIINFLRIEALVVTVPYIILFILFRDKPQIPPSKAQAAASHKKREKYMHMLKKLFTNIQYLKLVVGMALSYGTLTAMIATLDQLLKGLSYSNPGPVTAETILSAMLVGIIGNVFFSTFLNNTKGFRAVTAFCTFGGFLAYLLLFWLYIEHVSQIGYIIAFAGFAGFFLIPVPALFIAYASETVFPLDEGSSTGYLFAGSQTFGFLLGFLVTLFIDQRPITTYIAFSVYGVLLLISFIMVLTTKQHLRRQQFQQRKPKKNGLEDSLIIKSLSYNQ